MLLANSRSSRKGQESELPRLSTLLARRPVHYPSQVCRTDCQDMLQANFLCPTSSHYQNRTVCLDYIAASSFSSAKVPAKKKANIASRALKENYEILMLAYHATTLYTYGSSPSLPEQTSFYSVDFPRK